MAYGVSKCKTPHTIVKELILSFAVDTVNITIGEYAAKSYSTVPLSYYQSHRAKDPNDQLTENKGEGICVVAA